MAEDLSSIPQVWAQGSRSVPDLEPAAFDRRVSRSGAMLLKRFKHLRLGNDCLRSAVRTRSAALPQGGFEPKERFLLGRQVRGLPYRR
jgi:hypothetical protein